MASVSSPDEALVESALDVVLGADRLQLAQVVVKVLLAAAGVRVVDLWGINPFNAVLSFRRTIRSAKRKNCSRDCQLSGS